MTDKITVRVRIQTPLGVYCVPANEIEDTKTAYQDYVEEATALIMHSDKGIANFTDSDGDVVFLMPGTIKNSVITVERLG
ncbi:unnamed protein product [marine sediment metagenome]|uniref:Uncharacterized protein n=1 Tax=marine sediment metagenome TaxID=412755 RepID=X0UT81_9ZZZZ